MPLGSYGSLTHLEGTMPTIGESATGYEFNDVIDVISGDPISLSDYYGKVIWISFVAHW